MTVLEQWEEMIKDLTEETSKEFEKDYYPKEKAVYQAILADKTQVIEGTFDELAQGFSFSQAQFAGFMEGINTSLSHSVDLVKMSPKMHIKLKVDFEKLYYNMLKAKATWLSSLDEWNGILDSQKCKEITRLYHDSLQAKTEKIDRNAPCPCGSGKKYKKCCGANQ
jgi:uncharacterized protein YecA (UPF0149 family)